MEINELACEVRGKESEKTLLLRRSEKEVGSLICLFFFRSIYNSQTWEG